MTELDVAELVSVFISCFGLGLAAGALFRIFRKGAEKIL